MVPVPAGTDGTPKTRRGPDVRRQTLGAWNDPHRQITRFIESQGHRPGAGDQHNTPSARGPFEYTQCHEVSYSPREGRRGSGSGTSKRPPDATPAGTTTVMSWPVVGARTRRREPGPAPSGTDESQRKTIPAARLATPTVSRSEVRVNGASRSPNRRVGDDACGSAFVVHARLYM